MCNGCRFGDAESYLTLLDKLQGIGQQMKELQKEVLQFEKTNPEYKKLLHHSRTEMKKLTTKWFNIEQLWQI